MKRIPFLGLAVCFPMALALLGCQPAEQGLVVSGRIESDDVHIGSKVGGRVRQVAFEESQEVRAGEEVVALEDEEILAELAQGKASAAQAQSQLDLLLAGTRPEEIARAEAVVRARESELALKQKGFRQEEIHEAEAEVESAKSDLSLASSEYQRTRALFEKSAVDRRELDNKQAALDGSRAKMRVALERQALYRSGSRPEEIAIAAAQLAESQAELERLQNGPRKEEIAAQAAAVDAARANISRLEEQLEETRIKAPEDAVVETLDLEPGDLVKAGESIAVLNLNRNLWVRCYVPENRLGAATVGREVEITVDSYPGKTFKGRIRRLSSVAEFTPRNVQTNEKRAELVFEMKVDLIEDSDLLRAGMYADVHLSNRDAEEARP